MSHDQPPTRAGCKDHGWTDLVEVGADADITITEDGRVLHGTGWVLPQDYSEAEVADGSLPSVKGATPEELPTLGDDQGG